MGIHRRRDEAPVAKPAVGIGVIAGRGDICPSRSLVPGDHLDASSDERMVGGCAAHQASGSIRMLDAPWGSGTKRDPPLAPPQPERDAFGGVDSMDVHRIVDRLDLDRPCSGRERVHDHGPPFTRGDHHDEPARPFARQTHLRTKLDHVGHPQRDARTTAHEHGDDVDGGRRGQPSSVTDSPVHRSTHVPSGR